MQQQKSYHNEQEAVLYIVPTPIGNLEDMTFRAVRILQEVNLIAAEDTRNTKKLCNHFNISTPLLSYHEHNFKKAGEEILARLLSGSQVAIVSDAGMPAISDPGYEIAILAISNGIKVVSLPGANAAITALVASGLDPQPFYFYGFLQRNKGKKLQELEKLKAVQNTMIFYEAPHRLKDTIQQMLEVMGDRKVAIAREISKKFEEYIRGQLVEVRDWVVETELRGEFVIVVEGNMNLEENSITWWQDLSVLDHVNHFIQMGSKPTEAIKQVAKDRNLPRNEVYQQFHQL